jgi:hypothetical protein
MRAQLTGRNVTDESSLSHAGFTPALVSCRWTYVSELAKKRHVQSAHKATVVAVMVENASPDIERSEVGNSDGK